MHIFWPSNFTTPDLGNIYIYACICYIEQYIFLHVSIYKYMQDFIVTLFVVEKYRKKYAAMGDNNINGSFMLFDILLTNLGCYDKMPQTE